MARWFVDRTPREASPSVNLRRLLPDARFLGGRDWEVSGCTSDARRLEPGQLYVAIQGPRHDGHAYVSHALEQGAAGVVVERPCQEAGRLQVVVPDARLAHARILHALAGDPSQQLRVVGLAGCRGKAVAGLFLRSIHEAAGLHYGGVGRSSWTDGQTSRPFHPDFPSPRILAEILSSIVQRGAVGAVVELSQENLSVSSIAEGVRVETAVVTQITDPSESLDDEARRERRRTFARLVRQVSSDGTVVLNADDPDCQLLGASNLDARLITFGVDQPADIFAEIERLDAAGCRIRLTGLDREYSVDIHLLGIDRVRQALAAAAAAWAGGISSDAIVEGLQNVRHLPGRFESVNEGQPFDVRVDQASSVKEVSTALSTMRSLHPEGRVICVIGSRGMADGIERKSLAAAVEARSDQIVFTADNPRSEEPEQIVNELLAGCRHPERVLIHLDRREAIEVGLSHAQPGDSVLILGKGRHAFQILADRVIPFDDRAVASRWLRERWSPSHRASA